MKHTLSLAMLLCLCSSVAHAGDIQVNLALESTDAPGGEFVSGMLALEVINLSSESIGNVHLRPESLEGLGLASDVLQFGSLGPGDAARSMERFHGLASSTEASAMSTWSLDYDEAGGQHRQLTLTLEHE